jgi:nicotinate-nucleotide adenylyltransferase
MPRPASFGSLAVHTPMALPGQRIGVMGGTFDPPHAAHAYIAQAAITRLGLDWLWWLVTPGNPLKAGRALPPLSERMAMCQELVSDPRIHVVGFEAELGSAFTVDTLGFLRRRFPATRFVWVMGADGLVSFHRWRRWREIARIVPIAVLDRPGERLKALASPAARALAAGYVSEGHAQGLAGRRPPAWTFLSTRRIPLSSTDLRRRAGGI